MSVTPLLSIGMIFKNEERCIERCLKSLQPLRDAIPCELVMADTGATDGSREIAERYADEVFDFEWVDDFAAARNAVMDRCHGKWYFSIDCDEWLDPDIAELVRFLRDSKSPNFAFVVMRNYHSAELEKGDNFSNFMALRLVRMDTGIRFQGLIHESWPYREPSVQLSGTVLHHDGYFYTDDEALKKKMRRNRKLLRQKLEQQPDNLLTLLQCVESGDDADCVQYIRQAVEVVQAKRGQWERFGGCVMRHAIQVARKHELSEYEEWLAYAEKQFPDSIFVRVDVNYSAFFAAHNEKKWEKAIHYGEGYRRGLRTLRAVRLPKKVVYELGSGTLLLGNPAAERTLLIGLADAYLQAEQPEKALEILGMLDGEKLTPEQVSVTIVALCQLHVQTQLDISAVLAAFYGQLGQKEPDEQKQKARLAAFDRIAAASFTKTHRKEERAAKGYHRPAYTAFAALADRCEAGRGAKIMTSNDPAEMREWLLKAEDWQALPIEALEHALAAGVVFPLEEKPLPIEVLDGLAAKLTHDDNPARKLALALPEDAEFESLQSLCWAQALVLAALRSFDWSLGKNSAPVSKFACPEKKKDEDQDERPKDTPEVGLALIRRFAQLESALLPLLYAPALLAEENAALLPPMHRWGLYCARAFAALDAGNPQEYLATLRKGLAACPGEKEMVQFLLDRFLEDARPKTNPELLALAEKIRAILAAYDPDSPAVKAIRESDAYKQVAWIIEETPGIPVQ